MTRFAIRPIASREQAEACARMMAEAEPWITLRRDYDACRRVTLDETRERYVALDGERLAGFVILNLSGAFVGYVQTLCAAPAYRGSGVGTALLTFAEERIFREHPNVFICVSDFNPGARRLYERLGYTLVGELTDYVVTGHSELLLRKTRGPLNPRGHRGSGPDAFVPAHVERTGFLRLRLAPDAAVALLTPEGERRWIEGWAPEYLHPRSGADPPATGTVFRTRHGGEETLWLVLGFDDAAGAVDYVRVTPGSRIGTVSVRTRSKGESTTEAEVTYRMTALSPEGNEKLSEMTPEGFEAMLRRWEAAIHAVTEPSRPAR